MLAKQQQSVSSAALVEGRDTANNSEIEFSCPNCGTFIGASESRPISIGCIVRSAVSNEATQRKALHNALSNDKSEIPPISQEAMGEIFTKFSSRYTYFPPILTSMKFTIAEIQQRKPLMQKVVRTCLQCYERFVDEAELRRQHKEEMKKHRPPKKTARPANQGAGLVEPISLIGTDKGPDRRTDMAFTNLQVTQRNSSRVLQNKQLVREKLIHSIGGNTDALAIDWEVVPPMAIREMRRTAATLQQIGPSGADGGGGGAVGGPSSAITDGGDVIFRRGRNTAPPPLNYFGLGESPITAFDVPLEVRLMSDLFAKVTGACESFATESSQPVPANHPLYTVYRRNHNRLPAPPVPIVHSELPHPMSAAPLAKQVAVRSEVSALEDDPIAASARAASVATVGANLGWGSFTADEMAMLADVLADDTIVIESSDEDEDEEEEEEESDYDSEAWRDADGGYYQ